MKDEVIESVLKSIPKLEQVQYSTNEQLEQLIPFAIKLGLYDASDFLKKVINREKV